MQEKPVFLSYLLDYTSENYLCKEDQLQKAAKGSV